MWSRKCGNMSNCVVALGVMMNVSRPKTYYKLENQYIRDQKQWHWRSEAQSVSFGRKQQEADILIVRHSCVRSEIFVSDMTWWCCLTEHTTSNEWECAHVMLQPEVRGFSQEHASQLICHVSPNSYFDFIQPRARDQLHTSEPLQRKPEVSPLNNPLLFDLMSA